MDCRRYLSLVSRQANRNTTHFLLFMKEKVNLYPSTTSASQNGTCCTYTSSSRRQARFFSFKSCVTSAGSFYSAHASQATTTDTDSEHLLPSSPVTSTETRHSINALCDNKCCWCVIPRYHRAWHENTSRHRIHHTAILVKNWRSRNTQNGPKLPTNYVDGLYN